MTWKPRAEFAHWESSGAVQKQADDRGFWAPDSDVHAVDDETENVACRTVTAEELPYEVGPSWESFNPYQKCKRCEQELSSRS